LIGLVLVGFFMLFILASSTSNLHLTGHAVVGADQPCGGETNDTCEEGYSCDEGMCVFEEVCDINNLNLCDDTNCEGVGGYWYDSSCNAEEQPSCSNDLTLCLDEINCTTLGSGYWYDNSCNVNEQLVCDSDNLNLCDETNCTTLGSGYWYDSSCNADEESCTEEWNCGGWADCSGTSQTRTCTDTNECGTEEDKPLVSQSCEEEETTAEETTTEETTTTTTESTEKTVEQIIAEMESAQVTPNEEAENSEEQKNLESLGELTGGIVGGDFNESECSGCVFDEKCYKVDKRKNNSYCTEEGWSVQKEINVTCVEDFECLSNSCEEEQCGDYNWLRKFFDWIKGVFIKEIELNETQIIVSDEVVE